MSLKRDFDMDRRSYGREDRFSRLEESRSIHSRHHRKRRGDRSIDRRDEGLRKPSRRRSPSPYQRGSTSSEGPHSARRTRRRHVRSPKSNSKSGRKKRARRDRGRSSSPISGDDHRNRKRGRSLRSSSGTRSRPRSRHCSSRRRDGERRSFHFDDRRHRSMTPPRGRDAAYDARPPAGFNDVDVHADNLYQNRLHQPLDQDFRHREYGVRRSYSHSVERQRARRSRRRNKRRHRRRRSHSSSSVSPPRVPVAAALPTRAGVVSDDDEGANATANTSVNAAAMLAFVQQQQLGSLDPAPADFAGNADQRPVRPQRKGPRSNDNKRKRDSIHSESAAHDDSVGHFLGGPGTIVAHRYRVVQELGIGTFGRVVECLDLFKAGGRNGHGHRSLPRDDSSLVAIKMVRKIKRYYESALIEADIVDDVNRRGGRGLTHFAVMHDAFSFRGHYCLVFESLGPSLYDYLKRNKYQPFPMHCIQDFSQQLLEALEFIHSVGLVHTDLKPENILVTKCRDVSCGYLTIPECTRIKVIDFGGATYDYEKKSSVVNTRQYRAPEVILGVGWSMPSDIWSLGCILAELYQGELLFATHDNSEHLALMEQIVGPFPPRMLQRAIQNSPLANKSFGSNGRHRMERVLASENASYVLKSASLETIVRKKKDAWFLELLRRMLVIDPDNRSTARHCLRFCRG